MAKPIICKTWAPEESIPCVRPPYALAPEVRLFRANLMRAYIETKRLDEAENQLDRDRAGSTLARAQRNGFKGDPQRIPRAAIRLMRNPSPAVSVRKEIGDKDFNAVTAAKLAETLMSE